MNNGNNYGFSWMLHLPSSVTEISQEEFFLFHRIDRDLYTTLVFHLSRHPIQSIRVLGFWIWLERVGYRRTTQKILRLVPPVIIELADEAVTCLNCMAREAFFPFNDIPVMKRLMDREISLEILHRDRRSVLQAVEETVNDVCMKVVGDIMYAGLVRIQRYHNIMLRRRGRR